MNIRDILSKPCLDGLAGRRDTVRPRKLAFSAHVVVLAAVLCLIPVFQASPVAATSVNRLAICNVEGYPGETIDTEVILQGTDPGERAGYWSTHYKSVDGDDDRMDITSWISFEPSSEYTISEGESKAFVVRLNIPGDARPGLWGATSADAEKAGHSDERRTYIIFKDTSTESGSLYSGLLIPVSVTVMGNPNVFTPFANWVQANVMVSILIAVVIVLLSVMLTRRRRMKAAS